MSCCPECQEAWPPLSDYRDRVMGQLEDMLKNVGDLRPGSADCDVNPLVASRLQQDAVRGLEMAYDAVGKFLAAELGGRANRG